MAGWYGAQVGRDENQEPYIIVGGTVFYELPRGSGWRGCTLYLCEPIEWPAVVELLRAGDTLYGRNGDDVQSVRVKCGGRNGYTIYSASGAWSVSESSPGGVEQALGALEDDCIGEGFKKLVKTAASAAGTITRKVFEANGIHTHTLPARVRAPAHSALHTGAMVVMKGSQKDSIAVDRVAAYLDAMGGPVPVPGSWFCSRYLSKSEIITRPGIVRAVVWVDPDSVANIGPLPVDMGGTKVFPVGVVMGQWSTRVIRRALDRGAVLISIEWAMSCRESRLLEPLQARLKAIESKGLRKRVYTRAWGRFGSLGGWAGTVVACEDGRDRVRWVWTGGDYYSPYKPRRPDYRPDWAMAIGSENMIALCDAMESVNAGSVAGAHVDCFWSDDKDVLEKANNSGHANWAVKGEGYLRNYAVGVRSHGGDKVCAGARGGRNYTEVQLAEWASKGGDGILSLGMSSRRNWLGGLMPYDKLGAGAVSVAVEGTPEVHAGSEWDSRVVGPWCAGWRGLDWSQEDRDAWGRTLGMDEREKVRREQQG